jgi:ankyrin repeat protein
LLIHNKANPNLHDIHGNDPLWTAIMNSRGKMDIIELLLDAGADSNHKNKHGRSPLDMASTIKNGIEKPFVDRKIL